MRINHNISALNTSRQMALNLNAAAKSMEKLSSGLRINRAADDAAGLSISEKMRAQIRSLQQATRNAQDGISFIQTAEGALNEVSDMLARMKELKVQAENGTYDTSDIGNIRLELKALSKAIDDILDSTSFNGKFMLQNDATSVLITDDTGSAIVTIDSISFKGKLDKKEQQQVDGDGNPVVDGDGNPVMETVDIDLIDDLTVADMDTYIDQVNTDRAQFGAYQNQLEHTINNLNTTAENLSASESRIRDVDMAKEMTEYTKNSILLQASQAMLAQANSQPQNILQLLR